MNTILTGRQRPRIKPALTVTDRALEVAGWGLVAAVWLMTLATYSDLPETIATHFNAAGEADGFGSKQSILMLPTLATVFFVGLTILNRFPHIFNYMTRITEENALRQYTIVTRMLRYVKLFLVLVFGLLEFQSIRHAQGEAEGLGVWFLPFTVGVMFLPLIYFMVLSIRKK